MIQVIAVWGKPYSRSQWQELAKLSIEVAGQDQSVDLGKTSPSLPQICQW